MLASQFLQLPNFLPTSSLLLLVFLQVSQQPSKAVVTSTTSYYHSDLNLDFLCKTGMIPAFVRDVPWDCASFLVCLRGRAFLSQCPGDKLYSSQGRGRKCLPETQVDATRCRGQLFNHVDDICRANPHGRIPSPESCAHYVDCEGRQKPTTGLSSTPPPGFLDGLLECSYPKLFSPATGSCQHHSFVRCRHTFEPKAPCDYFQYLQLYHCDSLNCTECVKHHPSCLSLSDGYHPVPGRRDVMMKCQDERTVDFIPCPPGYVFSLPVNKGLHSLRCERS